MNKRPTTATTVCPHTSVVTVASVTPTPAAPTPPAPTATARPKAHSPDETSTFTPLKVEVVPARSSLECNDDRVPPLCAAKAVAISPPPPMTVLPPHLKALARRMARPTPLAANSRAEPRAAARAIATEPAAPTESPIAAITSQLTSVTNTPSIVFASGDTDVLLSAGALPDGDAPFQIKLR